MKIYNSLLNRISWKEVLSVQNKNNTMKILNSMKPIALSKTLPSRRAAVLVPLCLVNDNLSLLFTVRSMQVKNNPGQVSFPGGMEDPEDKSLETTALRETKEEIGIHPDKIDVWGNGPIISRFDMTVTPFIAYLGDIQPESLSINTAEVEKAFGWSLADLCNAENFESTTFRNKQGLLYTTPVYRTKDYKIWGLTAIITHILLSALIPKHYTNKIKRP